MTGAASLAERLLKVREAMAARAGVVATDRPVLLHSALADRAGALPNDASGSGERLALHHRAEVERMSLAGTPVAQIAATLCLSERHVVALRAQLGVGRRR